MTNVERNVAMLQETYRLYATEGIQPVLDRLTDDASWFSVGPGDLPWCGSYAGRDGVASFYERLNDALTVQEYEVEQVIAQGEWVVALATVTARFKASGRVEQFEKADVFRIVDGRIAEFREYYDSAKALDALKGSHTTEQASV